MIEVKEIIRWYRDLPVMPHNLTSIQQEGWKSEHAPLFNKSFVGQKLSRCPAIIDDIGHDTITASAYYDLDYSVDEVGRHYNYKKNKSLGHYATISYEILYDKANFYNKIISIYPQEMVELEGIINKVSIENASLWQGESIRGYDLSIQLSLRSINKTETKFLHAELLDENLRYRFSFRKNFCFIATACYGSYDAQEVLILRQFRDDKLLKNSIGKGFVKFYYSVSPFFAKQVSKSDLLKKLVRRYFLKPVVTKLQRQNNKNN